MGTVRQPLRRCCRLLQTFFENPNASQDEPLMTSQDTLQRARNGDVGAIATLLNQALHAKGMVAKVSLTHTRLKILVESEQVPDADQLTTYLRSSLTKLAAAHIHTVQIYGRQSAATTPAWNRTFALPEAATVAAAPDPSPAVVPSLQRATLTRHRAPTSQWPQMFFASIAAITLILVGANLRAIHSRLTGTPNFAATVGADGRYEAPIVRSLYGIPVIDVTFNDQTFPMMVDTGASGTLITQPMAAALGVRPIGQMVSSTANGNATFDVGYVRSIEIDGAKIYNVPVAVGLADLEIGLLGHDFFKYFDVVIRQDVVEFHPRSP